MVIGARFLYPHPGTPPFPIRRASYMNIAARIPNSNLRDFIRNNALSL